MHSLCELDLGPSKYRPWLQRAYWVLAAVVVLAILSA
jgi:hypothetical protein